MPKKTRQALNITFPGVDPALARMLERFARDVDKQLDENRKDDVRPLDGSTEPLGAGGVYYIDSSTSPVDRQLPSLDPDDAGKRITFVRRDAVGTAIVRANAPATIAGEEYDFIPGGVGAYEVIFDGENWYWVGTPPGLMSGQEWSADQLRGGPFPASLGVSGTATLISDPQQTGVTVRGFGYKSSDAVRREFTVPTGTQGFLGVKTYYRAQSGPTGHAMVTRYLHARQYSDGTGIPSGYVSYTLPAITMPSGFSGWRYSDELVALSDLGITQGRVEVVFSRYSGETPDSNDLDSMLLVESISLEIEV